MKYVFFPSIFSTLDSHLFIKPNKKGNILNQGCLSDLRKRTVTSLLSGQHELNKPVPDSSEYLSLLWNPNKSLLTNFEMRKSNIFI